MTTKMQIVTFTDTETTGLDENTEEVIQIAAIKVAHPLGEPENIRIIEGSEFELKIKPTKEVPPEIAALNGYNPEVWEREGVDLDTAMIKYFRYVEWTNFGGQNPAFDKRFLEASGRKCGLQWPRMQGYRLVAVEMLAWPLFLLGKIPNVKQETLAEYFGLGKQTHDALDDVRQSVEIYRRLLPKSVSAFRQ